MSFELHALRQTAASVFAFALLKLFPSAQLMDCEIDQIGFSYTFYLEQPLDEGIVVLLEEKMREVSKLDLAIESMEMMRENAMALFRHYKQFAKADIVGLSTDVIVPIIKIGDQFYDYATPPYLNSTAELPVFKLQKIEQVQGEDHTFRVRGTAFSDKRALKNFLKNFEEAKKNDHRVLGRELQLFSQIDDAGKEGWFWLPKGARIREALIEWWRSLHLAQSFQFVKTPRIVKSSFLKNKSASVKFEDDLVIASDLDAMHAKLFRINQHSYRELPMRFLEAAEIFHYESASTQGLFKSQSTTIDKASSFCLPSQVNDELISSLQFIEKTVNIWGFEYQWYLTLRGTKFAGTIENWDRLIKSMKDALDTSKHHYLIDSSGVSFNGPRILVRIKDALGRVWDGPYIEVNLNHSESSGLRYQGADGEMHMPYMITRSMFGSLERFIAILLENSKGLLPLWLAPEQVRLMPIAESHRKYAEDICKQLASAGIRSHVDNRAEGLGAKVHMFEREKIPYGLIIGDLEEKEGAVNVRSCSQQGKTTRMKIADFLQRVQEEARFPA